MSNQDGKTTNLSRLGDESNNRENTLPPLINHPSADSVGVPLETSNLRNIYGAPPEKAITNIHEKLPQKRNSWSADKIEEAEPEHLGQYKEDMKSRFCLSQQFNQNDADQPTKNESVNGRNNEIKETKDDNEKTKDEEIKVNTNTKADTIEDIAITKPPAGCCTIL
ncbi:hypothetical protein RFI_00059 [Reticulomyxa filosa]|uniref:Uncharacterized protein n=1 Tax=Reticulomyxa filosa TaxID=46433 RepID=X6PFX1_RETFI|nr:hypothetical protein RFI_00059 [Reticulomyxa filosa]|eukprot:ETO37003.1 hypothetical protein RFI_00059 [Reticulomyxa filosa]